MNRLLPITWLALTLVLVVCQRSEAQSVSRSFGDLQEQLEPGDTIFVADRQGRETSGTLARLSPTSLVIVVNGDEREIQSAEIGWVEKRGDSLKNGAWIGAVFVAAGTPTDDCSSSPGCVIASVALGAAMGAGIGALWDWAMPGRTLVYGTRPRSPHALRPGRPISSLAEVWTKVRTGDTISVFDTNGRMTRGAFAHVSTSSITLRVDGQLREIPSLEVRQMTRRGSRVWQGMLLGAAVGVTLGASLGVDTGGVDTDRTAGAATGFFAGGTLGTITGALIPRHILVYRSAPDLTVRVVPVAAPGRSGAIALIRF
jgi:hypothetical protein